MTHIEGSIDAGSGCHHAMAPTASVDWLLRRNDSEEGEQMRLENGMLFPPRYAPQHKKTDLPDYFAESSP